MTPTKIEQGLPVVWPNVLISAVTFVWWRTGMVRMWTLVWIGWLGNGCIWRLDWRMENGHSVSSAIIMWYRFNIHSTYREDLHVSILDPENYENDERNEKYFLYPENFEKDEKFENLILGVAINGIGSLLWHWALGDLEGRHFENEFSRWQPINLLPIGHHPVNRVRG